MSNNPVNLHAVDALQNVSVSATCALRPLQPEDAAAMLQILDNDPSIRQRVSIAQRMADQTNFIKEVDAYKRDKDVIRYSIWSDDAIVGLISFWRLGDTLTGYLPSSLPERDTYGFGYFVDPSQRGKGVATDAMKALLSTAREYVSPRKFIAFCEDDNPASIKVLLKSGFIATDTTVYFPEENWHERLYEIIPES